MRNCAKTIEDHLRTRLAAPVHEGPHRGAVRDVGRVRQTTEALLAHVVEQLLLHMIIGHVVQALQDQDSPHRLGRVRRTWAKDAHRGRGATRSTSAANAAKSMCDSMSVSGSPSQTIFGR